MLILTSNNKGKSKTINLGRTLAKNETMHFMNTNEQGMVKSTELFFINDLASLSDNVQILNQKKL